MEEGENEFRWTFRPVDPQKKHEMSAHITPRWPKEEANFTHTPILGTAW